MQLFHIRKSYLTFGFGASSATHFLLLVPTLVTLQIFDRVLSGRNVATLAMLLLASVLALIAWGLVEAARSRHQAALATSWEGVITEQLSSRILRAHLHGASADAQRIWIDIDTVRGFVGGPAGASLIDLPWSIVYLLVIFAFHPLLGLVALGGIIVLAALAWFTEWRLRNLVSSSESAQAFSNYQVAELTNFTEVFQAHGQFGQAKRSLLDIKGGTSQKRLAAEQPGHNLKTIGKLLRQILQLMILAVGAWLVIKNQATAGVMIAGSILLGKALSPLEILIGSWKYVLEARKANARLEHALEGQARVEALIPNTTLPRPCGALQAEQLMVNAAGSDAAILKSINFNLPVGAMLIVLGPSGSGKSTLARVLAGVVAPNRGVVALDGAALLQYAETIRGPATGYLPQDVQLHSGSIAHNIARQWGSKDALSEEDNEHVIAAAKLAGAHELITNLPKGYDTMLGGGPEAYTLSGGERQRIGLARAVFGSPSLVILDEPNSQLDAEGEATLEGCLRALREKQITVVAVTHRPHLIELSSHILVLREGRVEQFGQREQVRQWMIQLNQVAMKNRSTHASVLPDIDPQPAHRSTLQAAA